MRRASWLVIGVLFAFASACGVTAAPSPSPTAVRDIDVGAIPRGIVFDFGSVWVGASDKGEIERLEPTTGAIVTRIKIGDPAKQSSRARVYHGVPVAIASGFGSIWATGADETLTRVDPKTLQISSFPIGIVGSAIAASEDAIWIASFDDGALLRFDPVANAAGTVARGQGSLQGIAAGGGSVWVVNRSGQELLRFDARSAAVTAHIPIARDPQSVAIGAGAIWVTRESPRALLRIDPATNTVTATYAAEDAWGVGGDMLFSDDGLWLGNIARIDPTTGKMLAHLTAGSSEEQLGIAIGAGSVWIAGAVKIRQLPLALVK